MSARAPRMRSSALLLAPLALCLLLLLAGSARAAGPNAWWHLSVRSTPGNLAPGQEGTLEVATTNLGDATAQASPTHPVTLSAKLPKGLTVSSSSTPLCTIVSSTEPVCGQYLPGNSNIPPREKVKCTFSSSEAICTAKEPLAPYERFEMELAVKVAATSPTEFTGEEVQESVSGGEVEARELHRPVKISSAPTPFLPEEYDFIPEDEAGGVDTQAGSHPFQLTTTFAVNQVFEEFNGGQILPATPELLKVLHVNEPPGLVGNANKQVIPQCTELQFQTVLSNGFATQCPENTAIGAAVVTVTEPQSLKTRVTFSTPVYNLEPHEGEPARFGFMASIVPITLDTVVNGGDYHIVVNANNTSKAAAVIESLVTIWGVPGDSRHDPSRGSQCLAQGEARVAGEACTLLEEKDPKPFLRLPTSCTEPLRTSVEGVSWKPGATPFEPFGPTSSIQLTGCEAEPFAPTMTVHPTEHSSNTPTGLAVTLKVPQTTTLEREGRAEADIRNTVVKLPEGVQLSPSAANGLQACSTKAVGWKGVNPHTETEEFFPEDAKALTPEEEAEKEAKEEVCPKASKVGTVRVKSPVLEQELHGAVYLAAENDNPFKSLFGIYIIVKDPVTGAVVKLAGKVNPDENTGQITSEFPNAPQFPFEEFELELFNGPRASVATPRACGNYSTQTAFKAWSGTVLEEALSPEEFQITSGPDSTGCANPQPFSPALMAGTTNEQAGAFTPFSLTIERPETDQALKNVKITLPPGVAGYLSHVTQCGEPAAEEGTCGPASLIGSAKAVAGLGTAPFTEEGGRVYITGPYHGAPFGLSIVLPAKAGPFDFGQVVTRSTINVDPNTAQLTVGSELPTMLNTTTYHTGAPVQLRRVDVTIDRPEFQFNPTNCSSLSIASTLGGDQGATVSGSTPFQVKGCQNLAFEPELTAETDSRWTKVNGTTLKVVVKAKPGQANIAKTKIAFPLQLPSRLTTIQKACPDNLFNANPASCPEGSVIGSAVAHTPVLNSPLVGPAYLVSHGGAAFPDAEFVLQGEGVTLILDGQTDIKRGITTSTFSSVPDAPVSTFEVMLPAGPHSAFTGYEDLCKPTTTVRKTVTVRKKIGKSKRFRSVKKTVNVQVAQPLQMPTILTGQNGDVIEKQTKLGVTGCKAVKPFKKAKAKPKKKKKKKRKK